MADTTQPANGGGDLVAVAAAGQVMPVPDVPSVSTLEVLDWKVAESKSGESFVTFLFELVYVYPPLSVAYALGGGVVLTPVSIVVAKRFAELHSLHALLERHFVCLPAFPQKTLTRRTDKTFVEARCQALLLYLRQLLAREDVQRTGWLQKFLGVASPAARVREARAQMHAQLREEEQRTKAELAANPPPIQPQHHQSSFDSALEDTMPVSGSLAHVVEVADSLTRNNSALFDVEHSTDAELPHHEDEEEESSEPATTSNSFTTHHTHTAPAATAVVRHHQPRHTPAGSNTHSETEDNGDGYDSDREYAHQMNAEPSVESVAEAVRRKAEGSRVHNVRRSGGGLHAQAQQAHGLDAFLRDSTSGVLFAEVPSPSSGPPPVPSNVALEFLSRSPVFEFLKTVLVDEHTLVAIASDRRTVTRMDSWLSRTFGSSSSSSNNSNRNRGPQVAESVTYASNSHVSTDLTNPSAALYAFRRRSAPGGSAFEAAQSQEEGEEDFVESLRIFFPSELTSLIWDAERRWIYLGDARGTLSVFSPSEDWTYAVKVLQTSIFGAGAPASIARDEDAPVSFMTLVRTRKLATGVLVLVAAPTDGPQLVAVFDVAAQATINRANFRFDVGPNARTKVGAIEACGDSERLLIGADRSITLFDLASLPHAPPPLLHRLANGHGGPIRCMAWSPSSQLLASGGDDRAIVVWRLAPKHAERSTLLMTRLAAHADRVRSVTWSDEHADATDRAPTFLASGDETGHVAIFSLEKKACVLAFRAHESPITHVHLTAQLALVTASGDRTTKMWQLA